MKYTRVHTIWNLIIHGAVLKTINPRHLNYIEVIIIFS